MATPLLSTKFYIPPVRPGLVPRPRLSERLNEGLMHKLTLVSAPAGFGKTTLLGEWARSCGRPVAWVSLDESDNDLARYLAYFVTALQTLALSQVEGIKADIGQGVLSAFQAPQPPPIESVLTALINEIAAIPDPFALVLDDYHVIKAQPIHDALTFLLDHLPPQMHLVIATRIDPPLPIARLRGRGQVTELRQTDLRFTPDEVAEFLNQVMGLNLSADNVAVLDSRTEGWIAGLQMAAVSMRGQEDIAGFIRAFTGSDRYILDYLVEEVLQRQPDSVQTFLLQTATLDRLTGPLCDAITGQDNGQEMLERLERANLFIVPLDNERRWYRYHHLFADLLRQRLHQAQPDLVLTLHRRASEWYEQNGRMGAAIDHVLSAGDFERAAHLIEQIAEATLMRSEVATFLSWVEALPDELVRVRPSLCLFHAWALLMAGRSLDAIESRLQNMEGDTDLISDKVAPLRVLIAAYQGRTSYASELSRQALEQLPEDDLFLRSTAAWNLSISCMLSGDFVAAAQALDEAARMGQETGNVMVAVMALCHLAEVHVAQGQLHRATEIYQRALELTADQQGRPLPIAGMALIGLGELWREWDDLEAATRYLIEGIELIRQWGDFGALEGYVALARVKQAQGDMDGARDAIQEAQQIAIEFDATEMDDLLVAMHQVQLWIAQGNTEAALRWVEEQGLETDIGLAKSEGEDNRSTLSGYHRWFERLILARVMLAQERPDEALALLEPILLMVEQQGLNGSVIRLQILKALAFQVQASSRSFVVNAQPNGSVRGGAVAQAMTSLERALSLAEPVGYVRVFVDEGEPMARLLRQAASRGIAPEYVSKLLAAFEGETKDQRPETKAADSSSTFRPSTLVEPLSEREMEVLRLLATELSSTDIAQELVVSVNTVRSHIKNIYSKLDVHSRYEAVARAKGLNLL